MTRILRYAARRLWRSPAFAITAVLTLTLGIGAACAVFSVVDAVLLRPLPFDAPEQLVDLTHSIVVSGAASVDQSDATYLLYRRDNRAFSDIGAYRATSVNLGGALGSAGGAGVAGSAAERVSGALATGSVFHVLGVVPERGRVFSDDDSRPGAPPVAMIGQRLWQESFNGDPAIVGKRVSVDGLERTVVGILPQTFQFPDAGTALWIPLPLDPANTKSAAFDYRAVGRLKPGVSVASAVVDLERILPQVPEVFPGRLTLDAVKAIKMRPVVRPLRDVVVGDVGLALWIVLGAVGVLLLIACANVANLFLARAEGRQRELAVRQALGAGRGMLLTEFLSEAGLVAALGGALGLACAAAGVRGLRSMGAATSIPRLSEVRIDWVVLLVAAAAMVAAALVVSALPVLRSGRVSLATMLMASGRAVSGHTRHRARRALVIAQVALALILLAAAGLLARSFERLRSVSPGFDATHALALRMTLPAATYPTSAMTARAVMRDLDAIAAVSGVRSVGAATKIPLDAESRQDSAVFIEDRPLTPGAIPDLHQIVFVTPDYFRAMGIAMLAGRTFSQMDPGGAPSPSTPEVVVSDALAQRYWKGESAIGKRIRMNRTDPWHMVVGVVRGVRDESLEKPAAEEVYCPLVTLNAFGAPYTPRDVAIVVRTAGDPSQLAPQIRRVVQSAEPEVPLYRVIPTSALLSEATARTTFTLLMLGVAALMALVIGAVGIYGVISYLVGLRAPEIGVRLALGATPADMMRFVTQQALVDAAVGVAFGLIGAAFVTRVLGAVLYSVSPTDPATLATASAVLLLTAFAASWLPARRAAALDPAMTLRD